MNKKILAKLIKFNTISVNSNLDLISFCADKFTGFGYQTDLIKAGNKACLFAYKKCDQPRIILSAHSDTVPPSENWTTDPFCITEKEGKYFGLGIADMKIFIAIMLDLAKLELSNFAFILTFDEETDFSGAKLIDSSIIRPYDTVIIGEPTGGKIIGGNKGLLAYNLTINGIAGHGSNPKNGISAIEKAAQFICELKDQFPKIAAESAFFNITESTMNIGKISGGTAINSIADKTEIEFEFRLVSEKQKAEIERIIEDILKKYNIEADLKELIYLEPYILNNKVKKEFEKYFEVTKGESYCTEANIFCGLTDNVLVVGPGDPNQAHKADEHIEILAINKYEKALRRLVIK